MTKKSKGRQKIEMAKMKNETNLQVTFSKRRSGIFKKASELCTLCGAEVALIVYSPSGKVFSFGHPNVDTVIDRFLNNNPPLPHQPNNAQLNESYRNSVIQDMNNELTEVLDDLESEKKNNEKLRKLRENSKTAENWWEDAVEEFSLSQCNEFKDKLESLKKKVTLEASKLFQAKMSHQNFYIGSSSNVAYGADSGSNINHGFDLFSQSRLVNINAFINNQNMVPSNHALQLRNHGNNTIIEGLVPGYNMNYTPWFNQNQMQNQNQIPSIKRESISEYDEHYHHGHHPHPRRDNF